MFDKIFAIKKWNRVSEKTLIICNLLGAITMILGSMVLRHKINKLKFTIIYLMTFALYSYVIILLFKLGF